jgi:hypothetical protein
LTEKPYFNYGHVESVAKLTKKVMKSKNIGFYKDEEDGSWSDVDIRNWRAFCDKFGVKFTPNPYIGIQSKEIKELFSLHEERITSPLSNSKHVPTNLIMQLMPNRTKDPTSAKDPSHPYDVREVNFAIAHGHDPDAKNKPPGKKPSFSRSDTFFNEKIFHDQVLVVTQNAHTTQTPQGKVIHSNRVKTTLEISKPEAKSEIEPEIIKPEPEVKPEIIKPVTKPPEVSKPIINKHINKSDIRKKQQSDILKVRG